MSELLISYLQDIDPLMLGVVEILMDDDPEPDTPEGKLLSAFAEAIAAYENYLFPELNMKVIKDE